LDVADVGRNENSGHVRFLPKTRRQRSPPARLGNSS
jgi:hypothetical protein